MDLYTQPAEEGLVDLRKVRDELKTAGAMRAGGAKVEALNEIGMALLLDIAWSLRPLGAEAADALRAQAFASLNETAEEIDGAITDERDFFVVGDLVHAVDDTEPGEITRLAFDQGELYASVAFANGHAEPRVPVAQLARIHGDEPEPEVIDEIAARTELEAARKKLADADVNTHEGEPGALYVEPDDVEADFDETPADPLELLRKASGGKKKGSKK